MGDFMKTCIIIVGPTASGKTALSIRLAQEFSTEIISADSRQCFQELNIGVAKPSKEELAVVPHHFIDTISIQDNFSAADYDSYAHAKINALFQQKDIVVLTGGTGLYIKAFEEGLDPIPATDEELRKEIIQNYESLGIDWLKNELLANDHVFAQSGEMQNPQRMMRALEVSKITGKSILSFYSNTKRTLDFNIIKIGIDWSRETLYQRINQRVDDMMNAGLLKEVKSLIPYKNLNALQTVGYKELFDHFDGNISLDSAIEQIKQHTRQYAKRQMTWFKKDPSIYWTKGKDTNSMLVDCMNIIREKLQD